MRFKLIVFIFIIGHNLVKNNQILSDIKLTDIETNVGTVSDSKSGNASQVNCTTPSIINFPYISTKFRKSFLMSLLAVIIIIYLFIGTAIICDDYFVPSLELISNKLKLEPDIAGSTFMAMGSSAPELATTLIGVFVAKDDIGLGTVVGSAVFNIAFVISICALFAGRVVTINWWPILRDSFFYLISICLLFIAMFDENISLIESIIFLVVYGIYIVFIKYNKEIQHKICNIFHISVPNLSQLSQFISYNTLPESETSEQTIITSTTDVDCNAINSELNANHSNEYLSTSLNKLQSNEISFEYSKAKQTWNIFIWPLHLIHGLTIPDCRVETRHNWFAITFLMSCVCISVYTYIIVWMITVIGFNLHIADTVMGLVFIAFGASIPDAIASLIVIREGKGDMALTNAIASNVFDILICLGVPWFLQTALIDPGSHVPVISKGLEYSTISLLSTVIFFVVTIHLNGWKLTPKYGYILMVWYLCFISMASLYELNVFGYLNPAVCFDDF